MRNLKLVLSLLVLMGSTGMASATEILVGGPGPQVAAAVSFPGFRLVVGRPGYYCFYQGHYYSRVAWDRFYRLHRGHERIAYGKYHGHDRNDGRHFDKDRNGRRD